MNFIRLFYEPNAEDQAAYNNELEKTRNLTSEIRNNFIGLNNDFKSINTETKQVSLSIGEVLNKLQKSRNLVGELRKDFIGLDGVIKKAVKIDSTPIVNSTGKIGQSIDDNIISKISSSEEAVKILQALLEKVIAPEIAPKITPSVDTTGIEASNKKTTAALQGQKDVISDINDELTKEGDNIKNSTKQVGTNIGAAIAAGVKSGNKDAIKLAQTVLPTPKVEPTGKDTGVKKEDTDYQRLYNFLVKDQRDTIQAINNELKTGINYVKETRKQYNILEDISNKLVDDSQDLLELSEKQLNKEKSKAQQALKDLNTAGAKLQAEIDAGTKKIENLKDEERILKEAYNNGVNSFELEKETLALIEKRIEQQKNLNKSLGLTGTFLKSAQKITEKLGLHGMDEVFKEARKEAEKSAKNLGDMDKKALGLNGRFKVMLVALKEIGKGALRSLKDPLVLSGILLTTQIVLLKKFFHAYEAIEDKIIDQRKQLALSYDDSEKLYHSALNYAAVQQDGYTTATKLVEARQKLNEALGSSLTFSESELETASRLSHFYGLSEEQNAHIYQLSKELGTTNEGILNTVLKTSATQKAQTGGTLSYQKILQKVSGVSGEILTKFKGNIKALTEAVMQADRLGLTLEQVDKIGESLLNFETSIESELKAELLTGKAINLEKARSAALSGDTAKLTNEIVAQVGNIHQFEKMNVIQRKAYAEAFGMTASEMGDMLRKQEFEAKLADSGAKSAKEKLEYAEKYGITVAESVRKDLEAQSLAEIQKNTFERINEILAKITEGPMKKFFHLLEAGLEKIQKIGSFFNKMTGGALGSALGTAVLAIPAVLGTLMAVGALMRVFSGSFLKNIMIPKPTGRPGDQLHVIVDGSMPGVMGGGAFKGMTLTQATPMTPGMGPRPYTAPKLGSPLTMGGPTPVTTPKGFSAFSPKAMGIGMGVGMAGMALNVASEGMKEGGAKQAVGVLGQTAQFAGMGAMFGPWGAAIGGLVGLGMGLFSLSKENEERRKAEQAKKDEAEKRTQDLIEALNTRPLQLNVGNESVAKFSTQQSLTNANPNYS